MLLVTVVVIIIVIIRSESYLSLLKSNKTIHRVQIISNVLKVHCEKYETFKVFCPSVPLARRQSPHTLNRRSAYACDAGAEITSMAILDRNGYLNIGMRISGAQSASRKSQCCLQGTVVSVIFVLDFFVLFCFLFFRFRF